MNDGSLLVSRYRKDYTSKTDYSREGRTRLSWGSRTRKKWESYGFCGISGKKTRVEISCNLLEASDVQWIPVWEGAQAHTVMGVNVRFRKLCGRPVFESSACLNHIQQTFIWPQHRQLESLNHKGGQKEISISLRASQITFEEEPKNIRLFYSGKYKDM